ncbi:hypothetical protein F5Y04DRAFT_288807 [Hypomontagnella monticulosa]|nr:hypothetical protein F5Y04DRAFT_288807 [Hypomontagnella monticulosa]
MAFEVSASEADANQWSDAGVFDFERLLSFATSGSEDAFISAKGSETLKFPKQLACKRCHSQKLRCVRKRHGRICERCLSANLECVSRQPQRMGRPIDCNTLKTRPSGIGRQQANTHSSTPSTNTSLDRGSDTTKSTSFLVSEIDSGVWPGPSQDSSAVDNVDSNIDEQGNGDNGVSNTTLASNNTNLTPYASYTGPIFGSNSLLDLDDPHADSFSNDIEAGTFASHQTLSANDTTCPPSPPEDPVEQLSRLHLELYQCLTSVKAVERMKKEKLRMGSSGIDIPIDTSWSEHLFQTAERFIDALQGYVGAESDMRDAMDVTDAGRHTEDHAQIDMATGLMIVSCYTRLLQIFEVVVFVVETFREMDCPGTYVQINFGSFVPAKNKDLHARLLGQYVLHLLERVSEVVDRAVASRQPYDQAIAEIQGIEAKLKERVLATLR